MGAPYRTRWGKYVVSVNKKLKICLDIVRNLIASGGAVLVFLVSLLVIAWTRSFKENKPLCNYQNPFQMACCVSR